MANPEFLHSLKSLQARHRGCVATIGSFDGVHRGHQAVLQQVIASAKALNLPSLVMVFEPQPNEFFSRESAPPRLMRLRDKTCALFDAGIDRVLCLKFNEALRSHTPQAYIEEVLINGLAVKHLVIGDDFRFGCDRSGDFSMLVAAGKQHGFTVSDTQTLRSDDTRISSTRIRALLQDDNLAQATALLGRPYAITGRVQYGKQLGRTLGFPTLNVGLGPCRTALQGVYTVKVSAANERGAQPWQGVANIGVRPTVNGGAQPLLEVHLLNANAELYGRIVSVTFEKKLRNEQRFADVQALKQQIALDVAQAKAYFKYTV